jgi:phage gp29-like protein
VNEYLVKPFIILNWGVQEHYPKVRITVPEPEDLKVFVDSITPLIDRGLKVSASDMRDKFGMSEVTDDEEVLVPMAAASMQNLPVSMNRRSTSMAINRVSKSGEQEIDTMTDEAMSEWEEVAEDFMNPIIAAANGSQSYDEFLSKLPQLQQDLGAEQFVEQMAEYLLKSRALGDSSDA